MSTPAPPTVVPAESLLAALRRRRLVVAAERADLRARRAARRARVAEALATAAALREAAEHVLATSGAARAEVRAEVQGAGRARPGFVAAASPLRVLVVDDLPLLRRMIGRQLAAAGHAVVGEAGTVAEAVARTRALAQGGRAPDVLVLDVQLPDGLGTDVAARVAAHAAAAAPGHGRRPAFVFCTGDPNAALEAGCATACGGVWPVLEKPVPAAALDRAVREAARTRPAS